MLAFLRSFLVTPNSAGFKSRLVTPSSSDLNPIPKRVVCLTAGNISVVPVDNADGDAVNFVGVPAGFIPPFVVRRVLSAGTSSTVWTVEDTV